MNTSLIIKYFFKSDVQIDFNNLIEHLIFFFDVSLTVHLSITLANDQLDAQIF
jgi:hypothetical protein